MTEPLYQDVEPEDRTRQRGDKEKAADKKQFDDGRVHRSKQEKL
jgi:hypothetical protein